MTTTQLVLLLGTGVLATLVLAGVAVSVARAERPRPPTGMPAGDVTFDEGSPSPFLSDRQQAVVAEVEGLRRGEVSVASFVVGGLGLVVGVVTVGLPWGLAGVGLAAVPGLVAWRQRVRTEDTLVRQLPAALDVVAAALRVGHAFPDALRLAAEEAEAPLKDELARVALEHGMGVPVRDALDGLVARYPGCLELRLLASSVLFQRQAGGNLIDLMEQLALSIRDRVLFEDKARAITAEVRNSTDLLAALPFVAGVAVAALAPHHFDPLVETGAGRLMLGGALLGLLGGVVLVHGVARSLEP